MRIPKVPLVLAFLFAAGCGASKRLPPSQPLAELPIHVWAKKQKPLKQRERIRLADLRGSRNDFEGSLLARAAEGGSRNWVFSPGSANLALHLLVNGARGDSQEKLLKAMGYGGQKIDDVNLSAKELMREWHAASNRPVAVANSVWIKDGNTIKPAYQSSVEEHYGAVVKPFTTADHGKESINAWVSENTGGSIPTLINDLDEGVQAVLVNTISFRAMWRNPFEPNNTKDSKFTTADGEVIQVPTMHQTLKKGIYFENADYQALELGYEGEGFSMLLLLPRSGSPAALLRDWDRVRQDQFSQSQYIVDVALPRFTAESTHDLEPVLKDLGFGFIFDGADFSGLAVGLGVVSRAQQKCRIEVNEEGTKADSAVNADVMKSESREPLKASFIADRPFAYVVYGKGSLLFAGVCNDPRG
jgi:serpin B